MSESTLTRPPTSAAAAANYFLAKGRVEPDVPPIDQMKLQKLLFYGHAWYLALRNMPLFPENIEAWPWGPVVRDVYFQTREFGRNPVTKDVSRIVLNKTQGSYLARARLETPQVADEETKAFLDAIWDTHKEYTGIQLSNATHAPGEPWTVVNETYNGDLDGKPTIPNDLISEIFNRKLPANVAP